MTQDSSLSLMSTQLADVVDAVAPGVVQVQGRRRPASGLIYREDVVLTMTRVLGREDGLRIRGADGRTVDAELGGWDPATGLAVLRAPGLGGPALRPADGVARVGHFAVAVARSWSNAVTASAGLVSVIGGPLRTGRRRAIDEVIRTNAPMHDGFAGGAFVDTSGGLAGVTTATEIRGLAVVIPARIAWATAATLLEHGTAKRGYLGLAGQPADLPDPQRAAAGRERALLVVGVTAGSPAASAGIGIGDILVDFDGQAIEGPEDLLDLLVGRAGRAVPVRLLRGGQVLTVDVAVGERPQD
jgi:serine protease Do